MPLAHVQSARVAIQIIVTKASRMRRIGNLFRLNAPCGAAAPWPESFGCAAGCLRLVLPRDALFVTGDAGFERVTSLEVRLIRPMAA